jgi:uncharacterized protein YdhG (YjbR/CyaY superfamily)
MIPGLSNSIDTYIAGFPESTRVMLTQMRETIRRAAPDAVEVISYKMPAYKLEGILVYFAGCKQHIGFYPTSAGINAFQQELSEYQWATGSVQFPLNRPLPVELITRIVKFRVTENLERACTS